jgi:hypothetical protein
MSVSTIASSIRYSHSQKHPSRQVRLAKWTGGIRKHCIITSSQANTNIELWHRVTVTSEMLHNRQSDATRTRRCKLGCYTTVQQLHLMIKTAAQQTGQFPISRLEYQEQ